MTHPLYALLNRLDLDGVRYVLSRNRGDTLTVTVAFVGERLEIEVFEDGHMEYSRFMGTEDVLGDEKGLGELLDRKQVEERLWFDHLKDRMQESSGSGPDQSPSGNPPH